MSLPPVHFVASEPAGVVIGDVAGCDLDRDYPYWLGMTNWTAQTYLVLRQHRAGLSIGTAPRAGSINVAHVQTWRTLGPGEEYRVSIRADFRRLFDVDYEILQNPVAVRRPRQIFIPYWPIPGLKQRDSGRTRVKTVAYAGRIENGNLAAAIDERIVQGLGDFRFRVVEPHEWHDMREVDVLLAIREFSTRTFDNKPASKLMNAWHANIPLIGGYDSAFAAAGNPGLDYLRVSSLGGLRDALGELVDDAGRYAGIVEAGRISRRDFTRERIAGQWLGALGGPIAEHWRARRESGGGRNAAGRWIDRALDLASAAKRQFGPKERQP